MHDLYFVSLLKCQLVVFKTFAVTQYAHLWWKNTKHLGESLSSYITNSDKLKKLMFCRLKLSRKKGVGVKTKGKKCQKKYLKTLIVKSYKKVFNFMYHSTF